MPWISLCFRSVNKGNVGAMGGTRFFLADLPSRTTEADLKGLFQDYGHVEHVDLKRKEQDGATKVIAFVTLETDDADYCKSSAELGSSG